MNKKLVLIIGLVVLVVAVPLIQARIRGTAAVEVEYWPVMDPTAVEGARSQRLDAYRGVRDAILARIHARFGQPGMAGL